MPPSSFSLRESRLGSSVPVSEDNGLSLKYYHDLLKRAARMHPEDYDDLRWALEYGGTVEGAHSKLIYPDAKDVVIGEKDTLQGRINGFGEALLPKYVEGKLVKWGDVKVTEGKKLAEAIYGAGVLTFLYSGVIPGSILNEFARSASALLLETNSSSINIVMPEEYLKLAEVELTSANKLRSASLKFKKP